MVLFMTEDSRNDADAAIIASVLNEDRDSIRRFVAQYRPIFLTEARRMLKAKGRNREDAEDITQVIFAGIFSNNFAVLRHYDASLRSLKWYLRNFAHYRIKDYLRHRYEIPTEFENINHLINFEQINSSSSYMELEKLEIGEQINSFLDTCSLEERQLFIDLFLVEYSPAEVSKRLGLSLDAVYQRKLRLRHKLAKYLSKDRH